MDEKRNYRVYIAIYDDVESTKDNPMVWSDEPLPEDGASESMTQASRLYWHFIHKLKNQS